MDLGEKPGQGPKETDIAVHCERRASSLTCDRLGGLDKYACFPSEMQSGHVLGKTKLGAQLRTKCLIGREVEPP